MDKIKRMIGRRGRGEKQSSGVDAEASCARVATKKRSAETSAIWTTKISPLKVHPFVRS